MTARHWPCRCAVIRWCCGHRHSVARAGHVLPSFSRGTSHQTDQVLPVMALGVLALAAPWSCPCGNRSGPFCFGPDSGWGGLELLVHWWHHLGRRSVPTCRTGQDQATMTSRILPGLRIGIWVLRAALLTQWGWNARQSGAAMPGPGRGAIAALAWSRRQKPLIRWPTLPPGMRRVTSMLNAIGLGAVRAKASR